MQLVRRTTIAWLSLTFLFGAIVAPAPAAADIVSTWTGGPGAAGDNTYVGFIDVPAGNATVPVGGFVVAGWFVDKTADGWAGADDVQVFQGTMDGGGKMLAKATIAQSRPDVASALGNPFWTASGYSALVPPAALSTGPQTLSVYAHTAGKGWWYEQVQVNVSSAAASAPASGNAPVVQGSALPVVAFERPKVGEIILTSVDSYDIIGYALDKSAAPNQGVAGSGIDQVRIFLGNDENHGGIFLGNADLGFDDSTPVAQYGGQFGSSGWRLTFKPTKYHVNTYNVFAYAHSVVSGKEDSVARFFAIHDR